MKKNIIKKRKGCVIMPEIEGNSQGQEQPKDNFEDVLTEVSDKYTGPCTIQDIEDMVKAMLATLPKIDRDKLREEMSKMDVPTFQTPTTFDINKGLAVAQAYKDRLVEIYMNAQRDYKLRKRCLDMLFDAYNVISKGASADKRKGEATMKYPIMLLNLEASETFMEEIEQIMANIKSAWDSISRQGSIIQSQIQLGEYRKRVPDMQSNGSSAEEIDYKSGAPKIGMEWGEL
jgi:hypothetical protein